MQSITKKILPILILGLLIEFSASSLTLFNANNAVFDFQFANAAETPGDNKGISPQSGTPSNLKMSRELKILRIGTVIFVALALHANLIGLNIVRLPHADDPARVLVGVNQVLCGKLESDFVTAGYLFIDTVKQTIRYAGAGHPPLLLWRGSEQKIYEFREKGIILGQFVDAQFQNIDLELKSGDRYFLYTDGIIEATNAAGERFGWDLLKNFIKSNPSLPLGQFADELIQRVFKWSGKPSEKALDDDLTLVVVDFENN